MKSLRLIVLVVFVLLFMNVSFLFGWFVEGWEGLEEEKKLYLGMEFVWVEGGCFKMGDVFGDGDSDEKPVHEVCVDGFWMGKYEVTFEEYDRFCEETGREKPSDNGWGRGKRPVINVSWYDAKAFAEWYSKKVGMKCRLPTEAEWEYACRSGGKREKFSGTSNEDELYRYGNYCDANCEYSWKDKFHDDGYKYTAPVGSYKPNGLGIYDMSGNVREWCEDRYISDFSSAQLVRGGSWMGFATDASCVYQESCTDEYGYDDVGFRLVCK